MLVDDDNDLLAVLRHVFEKEGFSVLSCGDAISGLELLREGPQPDIIVLDLLMPKMSGWQFRVEQ
ncbi:MAG TPA: response regulator, partial [Polyangiales bacterium]